MEIGKTAKMKNAEKTDILTRAVSTVVFTNSAFFSFLCFFNFCIFAENTIKIGGSAPPPKPKNKNNKILKKWSKLKSGLIMLRNISGPLFNFKNCVFCCFLACFSKILFFLQGERDFRKQKNKKTGPLFNFKKRKNWTTFELYSIYIYVYMYFWSVKFHLYMCIYIYRDRPCRSCTVYSTLGHWTSCASLQTSTHQLYCCHQILQPKSKCMRAVCMSKEFSPVTPEFFRAFFWEERSWPWAKQSKKQILGRYYRVREIIDVLERTCKAEGPTSCDNDQEWPSQEQSEQSDEGLFKVDRAGER